MVYTHFGPSNMIRAIHARSILEALARTAEAGPIFYALNKCIHEVDWIAKEEALDTDRERLIENLEISIRLCNALRARDITTVRELESTTAEKLTESSSPANYFGKKCLRETREVLASMGMKLRGDP